jgi:hypothetical protein
MMAEKCPGYRIRTNGEYVHVCEECSGAPKSDVNFGLNYQGDKQVWRDGIRAAAARQISEARSAGLDPVPVDRNRWV